MAHRRSQCHTPKLLTIRCNSTLEMTWPTRGMTTSLSLVLAHPRDNFRISLTMPAALHTPPPPPQYHSKPAPDADVHISSPSDPPVQPPQHRRNETRIAKMSPKPHLPPTRSASLPQPEHIRLRLAPLATSKTFHHHKNHFTTSLPPKYHDNSPQLVDDPSQNHNFDTTTTAHEHHDLSPPEHPTLQPTIPETPGDATTISNANSSKSLVLPDLNHTVPSQNHLSSSSVTTEKPPNPLPDHLQISTASPTSFATVQQSPISPIPTGKILHPVSVPKLSLTKRASLQTPASKLIQLTETEALDIVHGAATSGDYSIVTRLVRHHRKSYKVVSAACVFLEKYCQDSKLYFDLCEEGGIEEFVSAVSLFGKGDPALCVVFFGAIIALSAHNDTRVGHRLRAVGVPSAVIDILSYHKIDIALQTAGCECLAVIACSSDLSQSAVATLGGPGVVYRAITQNNSSFEDEKLARASLKAIRSIANNNERAAEYLVQVAALDPVSRTAELFTDHGLEQDVLAALQAFSFYSNGRKCIIMSSGLKAVTSLMLRNQEPRFLVECCNFVRSVAKWNDPECEQAMLESCIAERIVSVMQLSNEIPGEEGARLAWYACYACTFLSSFGSKSRQRLRRIGAIETTVKLFNRRKENCKVVHSATDAIAELVKNEPEARAQAKNLNIIASLEEAYDMYTDLRVRKALQWTIDYLSSPSASSIRSSSSSHSSKLRSSHLGRQDSSRDTQRLQSWRSGRFRFFPTSWKRGGDA